MKITIKNLKVNEGCSEETLCFSATMYVDGERAARVRNHGHGGSHIYDSYGIDNDLLDAAFAWAKEQTIVLDCDWDPSGKMEITFDKLDYFVDDAIKDFEERRWYRRHCKKETLFRLEGEGDEQWRTIRAPYSEDVQRYLDANYGDKVAEIANLTRV